jgi:hypothetical protein
MSGSKAAQGGDSMAKIKLIVAVVAIAAAGVLISWHLGLFEGKAKPQPTLDQQVDQETRARMQKSLEEAQKAGEKIHKSPSGS